MSARGGETNWAVAEGRSGVVMVGPVTGRVYGAPDAARVDRTYRGKVTFVRRPMRALAD